MGPPSSPRLLVLHALRLKGVAEPPTIADMMDVDVDVVERELEASTADGLVSYRPGRISGHQLTATGRAVGEQLLRDELDIVGARPSIEAAYDRFLGCNGDLLEVCTAWQIRDGPDGRVRNDHADPAHDAAVLDRLVGVHERLEPVLVDLRGALRRFAGHELRLRTALDRLLAGDHDYFTKPMFPSYHSTWFELHEDLLATLGRRRATEGSH